MKNVHQNVILSNSRKCMFIIMPNSKNKEKLLFMKTFTVRPPPIKQCSENNTEQV